MLSEKKSHMAQAQIDFLGMHFSQGNYNPDPNQIQQLLGIINFIRDFISQASHHIRTDEQTRAVKAFKRLTQAPPPLKISGQDKRIFKQALVIFIRAQYASKKMTRRHIITAGKLVVRPNLLSNIITLLTKR